MPESSRFTCIGTADDKAIFLFDDTMGIVKIVQKNQSAPDADGTFSDFGIPAPALSDSGAVVFFATLTGTVNTMGIFSGSGGMPSQIERTGQNTPDSTGTFAGFGGGPSVNASGKAAKFLQ